MRKLPADDDQFLSELKELGTHGVAKKYNTATSTVRMRVGGMGISLKDINKPDNNIKRRVDNNTMRSLLEKHSVNEIVEITGYSISRISNLRRELDMPPCPRPFHMKLPSSDEQFLVEMKELDNDAVEMARKHNVRLDTIYKRKSKIQQESGRYLLWKRYGERTR